MDNSKPYLNRRALICDSDTVLRAALRSTLVDLGFEVDAAPDQPEALRQTFVEFDPDLAIVNGGFADSSAFSMVLDARHGRLGKRPYFCAIATLNVPDQRIIRRTFGAGFDDVLLKPLTIRRLTKHIHQLAARRRVFIVTHDYVGPDRRKRRPKTEADEARLFPVPNPLSPEAPDKSQAIRLFKAVQVADNLAWRDRAIPVLGQILEIVERLADDLAQRDAPGVDEKLPIELSNAVDELDELLENHDQQHAHDLMTSIHDMAEHLASVEQGELALEANLLKDLVTVVEHVIENDDLEEDPDNAEN